MVGDVEAIDQLIAALKENKLVLKIMKGLQDYLSCEVKFSGKKKWAWLGQPHLIKNLEEKFGDQSKKIKVIKQTW